MKQLFSRHWTPDNKGQWSPRAWKQMRWDLRFPQITVLRGSFQALWCREGAPSSLSGLGRQSWESRKTKRVPKRRERENSGDLLKYSAEYSPAHAGEETIQGQGKETKRLEGKVFSAHEGPRIVPDFHQPDWQASWLIGHLVEYTDGYCLSSGEKLGLDQALCWCNLILKERPKRIKLFWNKCIPDQSSGILIELKKHPAANR